KEEKEGEEKRPSCCERRRQTAKTGRWRASINPGRNANSALLFLDDAIMVGSVCQIRVCCSRARSIAVWLPSVHRHRPSTASPAPENQLHQKRHRLSGFPFCSWLITASCFHD